MVEVQIGKFNRLRIIKERTVGFFFDGGDEGDILMPKRHQPDEPCAVDDELDVFVFRDAEERLTATVRIPFAQVGEVAWLKVVDTHRAGAFMDWNMTKDLLVPFREQAEEMVKGKSYAVLIMLDDDDRIIGTTRLDEHIEDMAISGFKKGQEVSLLLTERTELGFRAIVDQSHWGILYESEIFQRVEVGQRLTGFISKVREDGKLDLSLKKPGYDKSGTDTLANRIMASIREAGGFLELSDKSAPEDIYQAFGVSKKNYKQAVGALYKERKITIEPEGLRLAAKAPRAPKPAPRLLRDPKPRASANAKEWDEPETNRKPEASKKPAESDEPTEKPVRRQIRSMTDQGPSARKYRPKA